MHHFRERGSGRLGLWWSGRPTCGRRLSPPSAADVPELSFFVTRPEMPEAFDLRDVDVVLRGDLAHARADLVRRRSSRGTLRCWLPVAGCWGGGAGAAASVERRPLRPPVSRQLRLGGRSDRPPLAGCAQAFGAGAGGAEASPSAAILATTKCSRRPSALATSTSVSFLPRATGSRVHFVRRDLEQRLVALDRVTRFLHHRITVPSRSTLPFAALTTSMAMRAFYFKSVMRANLAQTERRTPSSATRGDEPCVPRPRCGKGRASTARLADEGVRRSG